MPATSENRGYLSLREHVMTTCAAIKGSWLGYNTTTQASRLTTVVSRRLSQEHLKNTSKEHQSHGTERSGKQD